MCVEVRRKASGKLPLAIINDVLFFTGLLLVPAVIALYYSLANIDRNKAAVGCGIIAVVIPIIVVLDIALGRLIYPVYNIHMNTPTIAEEQAKTDVNAIIWYSTGLPLPFPSL